MNDFFARHKRLAVLGLSRNPKSFSRQAFAFLKSQGYELFPVNPHVAEIDGQTCYPSIESLPAVAAAIFFTSPRVTEKILPACKDKGIMEVWFQQGSVDEAGLTIAAELGINYYKSCVFLHHPQSGFPHNMHRAIVKIFKLES